MIRQLRSADELRPLEGLQREVWGFDDVEVVPLHVLMTAVRHGGSILGAFDGGRLVGFSFGFLGHDEDGTSVLCSHLLAVSPPARGRGVGVALKWAQRDAALAAGIDRVVWTFDPLEYGNARLNLERLGGTSNRYLTDLYGELRDTLNAGLPTDRIEIVWELDSDRVRARAQHQGRLEADDGGAAPGPLLDVAGPGGPIADPNGVQRVRVQALEGAQALRRSDPAAALAWRLHLRATLGRLFSAGYRLDGAGRGETGAEYHLVLRERLESRTERQAG